ncbi:MAG TPA: hypothetical protein VKA48_02420 [Gammaproteobacteria bacterium]|nr:hypothetical protein [Gammaproteobacteria bacterium]
MFQSGSHVLPGVLLTEDHAGVENRHGRTIVLREPVGLHARIGRDMVRKEGPLNGLESRFLRKAMDLSVTEAAERIGMDPDELAATEDAALSMPREADTVLREIFRDHMGRTT